MVQKSAVAGIQLVAAISGATGLPRASPPPAT
jgi:formate dehydrogenase assembly factor FdhD